VEAGTTDGDTSDQVASSSADQKQPDYGVSEETQVLDLLPLLDRLVTSYMQALVNNEREALAKAGKSAVELQSLSTRVYLDRTVVPILLAGMAALAKER
jgi:hypothetical protein